MTQIRDRKARIGGQYLAHGSCLFVAMLMLMVFSGNAFAAYPEDPDKWKFDAQIYLWGASLGGKTAAGEGVDASFGDLLDNLEMAFMGSFSAKKDSWSMLADIIYLDLETTESATLPPGVAGPGPVPVDAQVELKGWVVNMLGGYSIVQSEQNTFTLTAGARYLDLDTNVNIAASGGGASLVQLSESDGAWNGVIGLQGQVGFATRWYLNYLLDVGTGDSDFTWQALLGLGYAFEHLDLKFGYRHLAWEFDDSDTFGKAFSELEFSGPYAGIKFKF